MQEPRYADDFALELLYEIINKRTSQRVKLPEGVFDMTTAVHGVYEAQTQWKGHRSSDALSRQISLSPLSSQSE